MVNMRVNIKYSTNTLLNSLKGIHNNHNPCCLVYNIKNVIYM